MHYYRTFVQYEDAGHDAIEFVHVLSRKEFNGRRIRSHLKASGVELDAKSFADSLVVIH